MNKEESIKWGEVIGVGTIVGLFYGILVALLICFFSSNWSLFSPVVFLSVLCAMIYFYIEDDFRVNNLINDRKNKHAEKQKNIIIKAQELVSESKNLVDGLNNYIQVAERSLDQAADEFHERAYAPFWDAVENAINNLGYFDQSIGKVVANSKQHETIKVQIDNERPLFSVSATNLPDARNTSARMRKIVRQAQKDFQFASIYEQRKTNQILVAGFGSLANAINNMTCRIEDSISSLSDAINVSFEDQNELIREQLEEIKNSIEYEGKERKEHEKKEIEILDNYGRKIRFN